jgi:broad specificity phosphatase PhoE
MAFMQHLVQRPETNIVVVSHGVWIEVCLTMLCPSALEYGQRRVYNCDMFSGECISEDGRFLGLEKFELIQ